jgi:hypothetical protein
MIDRTLTVVIEELEINCTFLREWIAKKKLEFVNLFAK